MINIRRFYPSDLRQRWWKVRDGICERVQTVLRFFTPAVQLWADIQWGVVMICVKRYRRTLALRDRVKFDSSLRPPLNDEFNYQYPNAFYAITSKDFYIARAVMDMMAASKEDFQ